MSKQIDEKIVYKGRRFTVTQKRYINDNGVEYIRDIVNPGDAAIVLPVTENEEVVFIKQFRESVGKVAFEQCAGFLRIIDGDNPLEVTAVHPESYDATEKLLNKIGFKKEDLRRSLGLVLQETNLFTGTIKDNIKYGNSDATDEDVINADVSVKMPLPIQSRSVPHRCSVAAPLLPIWILPS